MRLGSRTATVVGVLEPSVPYPSETEIIANVVTSQHHLSATMVTGRVHRMTELFGRLAPGATPEQARAELKNVHGAMLRAHAARSDHVEGPHGAVSAAGCFGASVHDRVLECGLILARTIRREGEMVVRAVLGASTGALRRVLLAESLLLCGAGAALGVVERASDGGDSCAVRIAVFGAGARADGGIRASFGWEPGWRWRRQRCWRSLAVSRSGAHAPSQPRPFAQYFPFELPSS